MRGIKFSRQNFMNSSKGSLGAAKVYAKARNEGSSARELNKEP